MGSVNFGASHRLAADMMTERTGEYAEDLLTLVGESSLDQYDNLVFDAKRDVERCHALLDAFLPPKTEGDVDNTSTKAERVRLALVAGLISLETAYKLLSMIAATAVIEMRAFYLTSLHYCHDVILGVTEDRPKLVYERSDEVQIVGLANAYHLKMQGE
jgi:hypothetical protein